MFRILSTSLFLICCNNFLRTINRTSKCILKSVQHSGSEPTSKTDQVYFMGLLAAGQRNLGRGIGLIISLLVFYFEETWHEKQTFPLTPRCLVTNQILTINSANYTWRHRVWDVQLPVTRSLTIQSFDKPTQRKIWKLNRVLSLKFNAWTLSSLSQYFARCLTMGCTPCCSFKKNQSHDVNPDWLVKCPSGWQHVIQTPLLTRSISLVQG